MSQPSNFTKHRVTISCELFFDVEIPVDISEFDLEDKPEERRAKEEWLETEIGKKFDVILPRNNYSIKLNFEGKEYTRGEYWFMDYSCELSEIDGEPI